MKKAQIMGKFVILILAVAVIFVAILIGNRIKDLGQGAGEGFDLGSCEDKEKDADFYVDRVVRAFDTLGDYELVIETDDQFWACYKARPSGFTEKEYDDYVGHESDIEDSYNLYFYELLDDGDIVEAKRIARRYLSRFGEKGKYSGLLDNADSLAKSREKIKGLEEPVRAEQAVPTMGESSVENLRDLLKAHRDEAKIFLSENMREMLQEKYLEIFNIFKDNILRCNIIDLPPGDCILKKETSEEALIQVAELYSEVNNEYVERTNKLASVKLNAEDMENLNDVQLQLFNLRNRLEQNIQCGFDDCSESANRGLEIGDFCYPAGIGNCECGAKEISEGEYCTKPCSVDASSTDGVDESCVCSDAGKDTRYTVDPKNNDKDCCFDKGRAEPYIVDNSKIGRNDVDGMCAACNEVKTCSDYEDLDALATGWGTTKQDLCRKDVCDLHARGRSSTICTWAVKDDISGLLADTEGCF